MDLKDRHTNNAKNKIFFRGRDEFETPKLIQQGEPTEEVDVISNEIGPVVEYEYYKDAEKPKLNITSTNTGIIGKGEQITATLTAKDNFDL